MKRVLTSLRKSLNGINGILLIIYTSIITGSVMVLANNSAKGILTDCLLCVLISLILCPFLMKTANSNRLERFVSKEDKTEKPALKPFLFIIPFLALLSRYIIYYPGAFSPDSFTQYEQVISGSYNDHHPAFHTLFAFKLPLLLTNGWLGSIVLFQIILLSLAIGYALLTVLIHTNKKTAILLLVLTVLNPQLLDIAMYPWKDVSFAIGVIFLAAISVNVYFSDGKWLKPKSHAAALIILLAFTTLVRHNAILFTAPYIFALALIADKRRTLLIVLGAAVLFAGVKYPLYSAVGVTKAETQQVEMMGLPMSVIGEVVSRAPEKLDEETKEFAYKTAPEEMWKSTYNRGYNSIKLEKETNNNVINEYGVRGVLHIMANCIRTAPIISLQGFIINTLPVYSVMKNKGYEVPKIGKNDYGITMKGNPKLQELCLNYTKIMYRVFPLVYYYLGALHLVVITFILAKLKLNRFRDLKLLFLILPMFAYNFATMLLLTGPGDATRFFFYSFLIAPLYLITLIKKPGRVN